jgi:hypothetical protein
MQPNSSKDFLRSASLWQGIAIGLVALVVITNYFDIEITRKQAAPTAPQATQAAAAEVTQAVPAVSTVDAQALQASVLPQGGAELPVTWFDLGPRLVASGAIDRQAFDAIYAQRGGLSPEVDALLAGTLDGRIRITQGNAGELLNVLWALGLANSNPVLDNGPMQDPNYGGAGGFASTGGWTLASGNAMDHYSAHTLISLTAAQQELVERVAKGVHRPCCGNSTYFPDCNHGMAMLGLLELLASQGADEATMYAVALQTNAYWFPSTYLTLASYEAGQGTAWANVDAKKLLSAEYSSSAGFRNISVQVNPVKAQGGGGCGV